MGHAYVFQEHLETHNHTFLRTCGQTPRRPRRSSLATLLAVPHWPQRQWSPHSHTAHSALPGHNTSHAPRGPLANHATRSPSPAMPPAPLANLTGGPRPPAPMLATLSPAHGGANATNSSMLCRFHDALCAAPFFFLNCHRNFGDKINLLRNSQLLRLRPTLEGF